MKLNALIIILSCVAKQPTITLNDIEKWCDNSMEKAFTSMRFLLEHHLIRDDGDGVFTVTASHDALAQCAMQDTSMVVELGNKDMTAVANELLCMSANMLRAIAEQPGIILEQLRDKFSEDNDAEFFDEELRKLVAFGYVAEYKNTFYVTVDSEALEAIIALIYELNDIDWDNTSSTTDEDEVELKKLLDEIKALAEDKHDSIVGNTLNEENDDEDDEDEEEDEDEKHTRDEDEIDRIINNAFGEKDEVEDGDEDGDISPEDCDWLSNDAIHRIRSFDIDEYPKEIQDNAFNLLVSKEDEDYIIDVMLYVATGSLQCKMDITRTPLEFLHSIANCVDASILNSTFGCSKFYEIYSKKRISLDEAAYNCIFITELNDGRDGKYRGLNCYKPIILLAADILKRAIDQDSLPRLWVSLDA